MKRSEYIVPLSKDHHFGLLCSWKIQKGLDKNIALNRITAYVDFFWKNHLSNHFEQEEQIIFPYSNEKYNQQIKAEHNDIRAIVEKIMQYPEKSLFEKFSHLLKDHIRFEERDWFPYLQNNLNETELKEIGEKLEKFHSNMIDNYHDEFWK
ncbi:hemerythrin domain-containing protein [Empedobacter sp.]|uniref:hemerythrin domain-containing protein n=1 Tax=Empedobacter sp. TaxID=1927715 RepID=UPI0028A22469|nr:hemerythrin domain-containing protein [Empedobacter sp.]